jgi:hypothetical protein
MRGKDGLVGRRRAVLDLDASAGDGVEDHVRRPWDLVFLELPKGVGRRRGGRSRRIGEGRR